MEDASIFTRVTDTGLVHQLLVKNNGGFGRPNSVITRVVVGTRNQKGDPVRLVKGLLVKPVVGDWLGY